MNRGERTAVLLLIRNTSFSCNTSEDLEDMLEVDVAVQTETEASQAELMDYAPDTTSGAVCLPQIGLGRR